jgi:hypothetical protein
LSAAGIQVVTASRMMVAGVGAVVVFNLSLRSGFVGTVSMAE